MGGRSFPVTTRYIDNEADTQTKLVEVLRTIVATPPGRAPDVLVFFAAEREIFDAAKALRMAFGERFEILPLYARLSLADQRRVFNPQGSKRRIVLATNVAETSLTVPNIGFVIDPGFARISRYSYRSKLQRLPIEPISQPVPTNGRAVVVVLLQASVTGFIPNKISAAAKPIPMQKYVA